MTTISNIPFQFCGLGRTVYPNINTKSNSLSKETEHKIVDNFVPFLLYSQRLLGYLFTNPYTAFWNVGDPTRLEWRGLESNQEVWILSFGTSINFNGMLPKLHYMCHATPFFMKANSETLLLCVVKSGSVFVNGRASTSFSRD